jgi:hypothetical protein
MTDFDSLDKRLDTIERDMRVLSVLSQQMDEIRRSVRNESRTTRQTVVFVGLAAAVLGIVALVVFQAWLVAHLH